MSNIYQVSVTSSGGDIDRTAHYLVTQALVNKLQVLSLGPVKVPDEHDPQYGYLASLQAVTQICIGGSSYLALTPHGQTVLTSAQVELARHISTSLSAASDMFYVGDLALAIRLFKPSVNCWEFRAGYPVSIVQHGTGQLPPFPRVSSALRDRLNELYGNVDVYFTLDWLEGVGHVSI